MRVLPMGLVLSLSVAASTFLLRNNLWIDWMSSAEGAVLSYELYISFLRRTTFCFPCYRRTIAFWYSP